MSTLFSNDPRQREKLRMEISRAAYRMKTDLFLASKTGQIQFGFAFNDGMVTLMIDTDFIRRADHFQLTEMIYNEILAAVGPKH
jgi:hypothetical protein